MLCLLGDAIGKASSRNQKARIMKQELRKLFGTEKIGEELEAVVLQGINNNIKDLFEIWSFPGFNKKKIKQFAYIEGKEHLDNALEKGRGALVAVSHFGSWKMIIAALAYEGYHVNQIGLDPRYFIDKTRPYHHNYIMKMEYDCDQSLPAEFIYIGKSLRKVFRALARNEVVMNSFDGFIGAKRKTVPFLNGTNRLALGPVILAHRTGAALLPAFAVRQKDNRHKIIIHEEIPIATDINETEAISQALETYRLIFEKYVADNPSHYCRTLYDRVIDPGR
jgi:KDO2-lipid IV(A) lauroyltransferase